MALFTKPKTVLDQDPTYPKILNYQAHLKKRLFPKRALLCYLPLPVMADMRGETLVRFSNDGLGVSWARVLNELGYLVDIITWNDADFTPTMSYDLVVFHGGHNFASTMQKLAPNVPVIHFLTGSYWRFNNAQEDQRRKDFAQRHGITVPRDRYIHVSEDAVNERANGIIVLGNEAIRETFSQYPKVIAINSGNFADNHFVTTHKDHATTRKHFMFCAGAGNIHKGLDLVLEAFAGLTDEHLHIVTVPDEAVLKVYKKELAQPNIHMHGETPMRTAPFYDVTDQCAFTILPSCSEGQPGTLIEGMYQGLIPIVTRETGVDVSDIGILLKTPTVASIKQAVTQAATWEPDKVAAAANQAHTTIEREYSAETFRKNLAHAIHDILQ